MDEHYYTEEPQSLIEEKPFSHTIKNVTLNLVSVSGVFAFSQKVDRATELLIENFTPSGASILDMGCGYGAIGLFLKALFTRQDVFMADVNNRAVDYAVKNANRNGLDVRVLKSDLFGSLGSLKFDDIVSNPPIAAGKKLNMELIAQSLEHLNPGGALWLVAFHNKGGETLKKMMKERFGNVEDVEKSGGIRVYRSTALSPSLWPRTPSPHPGFQAGGRSLRF